MKPKKRASMLAGDWNSRFWIDKIPNYTSTISVSEKRDNLAYSKSSLSLPMVKSPSQLRMISESSTKAKYFAKKALEVNKKSTLIVNSPKIIFKNSPFAHGLKTTEQNANRISTNGLALSRKSVSVLRKLSDTDENTTKNKITQQDKKRPSIKNRLFKDFHMKKLENVPIHDFPQVIQYKHNKDQSETSSDLEEEFRFEIINYSKLITEKILNAITDEFCFKFAQESYNEMLSASLILFSSSIMNKYLLEVLSIEIPDLANKSYTEAREIEYFDSLNSIINETMEEEMMKIAGNITIEKISNSIKSKIIDFFSVDQLVIESIKEEKIQKFQIVIIMRDELFEEFINDDWLVILVEDEINTTRLESFWDFFTEKLQKDFNNVHDVQIKEKIADYIYYDYLNEVVGGIWIESLIRTYIKDSEEENPEVIMPIRKEKRTERRATYLHMYK